MTRMTHTQIAQILLESVYALCEQNVQIQSAFKQATEPLIEGLNDEDIDEIHDIFSSLEDKLYEDQDENNRTHIGAIDLIIDIKNDFSMNLPYLFIVLDVKLMMEANLSIEAYYDINQAIDCLRHELKKITQESKFADNLHHAVDGLRNKIIQYIGGPAVSADLLTFYLDTLEILENYFISTKVPEKSSRKFRI